MTSFSGGGRGVSSKENVVHHGEIQSAKPDSMCYNIEYNVIRTPTHI